MLLSALIAHPEISSQHLNRDVIARARRRVQRAGDDALQKSGLADLSEEDEPREDAPYFEGVFLQDVYPRFSLDTQSTWLFWLRLHASRLLLGPCFPFPSRSCSAIIFRNLSRPGTKSDAKDLKGNTWTTFWLCACCSAFGC